jgi:signal transduction histidine kinase
MIRRIVSGGLSARLLLLTVLFVMLSEVLIYVPSIARYRQVYLQQRITEAHLATLTLHGRNGESLSLSQSHEQILLTHTGLLGVEVWRPPRSLLMLGRLVRADAMFDLRYSTPWQLIKEAFQAMAGGGHRVLRVVGHPDTAPEQIVEIFLPERDLVLGMLDYSRRILTLSVIISLLTASLVYASLQWLMVRSLRRVTSNLMAFREQPEDPASVIRISGRGDEIGIMESELARMQTQLRQALAQRSRMAALGAAVSRINHDLKSILSTVSVASDRLMRVDDPTVRRVAPLLVRSVEKAVHLCTLTQDLARGEEVVPRRQRFALRDLLDEVGEALQLDECAGVEWQNQVPPGLGIEADRERLFRVLLNLSRNATEAFAGRSGCIRSVARANAGLVEIEIDDNGPGIPAAVLEHLFEPFAGTGKYGGTGLGLATARDLARAHGGDLTLLQTGPGGTRFRVRIPGST